MLKNLFSIFSKEVKEEVKDVVVEDVRGNVDVVTTADEGSEELLPDLETLIFAADKSLADIQKNAFVRANDDNGEPPKRCLPFPYEVPMSVATDLKGFGDWLRGGNKAAKARTAIVVEGEQFAAFCQYKLKTKLYK